MYVQFQSMGSVKKELKQGMWFYVNILQCHQTTQVLYFLLFCLLLSKNRGQSTRGRVLKAAEIDYNKMQVKI